MKPKDLRAGQTAVSLITLHRDWALGHAEEQPTVDEFMLAMGEGIEGVKFDTSYLMDINAALVAMVLALIENTEDPDLTLRAIAQSYQDDETDTA